MNVISRAAGLVPGLALAGAVALAAFAFQQAEQAAFGRAWIEALVLAILIGAGVRSLWAVPARCEPGVEFAARTLLEIAIVLLGASVDLGALGVAGWRLAASVAAGVAVALALGFALARALGLQTRLALLVATGNAICGNSAIAAVAPAIGARAEEIGAAIAFTAALGVAVVLALPLVQHVLGLSDRQYGVLAGMTVYAVPQVLAATASAGPLATQIGALVKLLRVLMLGPVIVTLGLGHGAASRTRPKLTTLVPWFVVGFLAMIALRALGLIPPTWLAPMESASRVLTLLAMAALGLTIDLREATRSGARVFLAGVGSLLALAAIAAAMAMILDVR